MPIHDWTRVLVGCWHDFHLAWVVALQRELNERVLPQTVYAQSEYAEGEWPAPTTDEATHYRVRRRAIVIHTDPGDRPIARIEFVSPGNKDSRRAFRQFVNKAVGAIERGHHLLIVDLFPPTPRDPDGIHNAIWGELSNARYDPPPDARLTLAAYSAGPVRRAYVEPTAVGRELIEMPLFLDPDTYINVPLEETYRAAYRGVPGRWKQVLDAP